MIYDYLGQAALSLCPFPGLAKWTNAERYKLIQVAQDVGGDPDIIAAVIGIETANTFNPAIVNPNRPFATGLIQWIPISAKNIHGLPTWNTNAGSPEIKAMNVCQQLDLMRDYYKKTMPAGARQPGDEYVAVTGGPYPAGSPGAQANPGWDTNQDGAVSLSEIRSLAVGKKNATCASGRPRIIVTPEACGGRGGFGGGGSLLPLVAGAALVGGVWYFTRWR